MLALLATLGLLGSPAVRAPSVAVEGLLEEHGFGRPERDEDLDAVASVLAERLATGEGAAETNAIQLRFALAARGIDDTHVFPLTVRYQVGEGIGPHLPGFVSRLDRRLPPTHYGASTFGRGGELTTTVLLVHRGVTLERPLPRRAAAGTKMRIAGALRRGYFKPRVLVAAPGGVPIRDRPAWTNERRLDVTVYFDGGPGTYEVQIIADSQYGPTPLNVHKVYVGVEPPALPVIRLAREAAERPPTAAALVELINALRTREGRRPLLTHRKLEKVAQAHAEEMARTGRLAHTSPDSGTLTTRLRAEGVSAPFAAENLAEAADAAAAMAAFVQSPGHRRNLLLPELTHIGVGAEGRYYSVALVQLE